MMAKLFRIAFPMAALLFLSACGQAGISDSDVYTLYSNSPSNPSARFHEGTFDTQTGIDSKVWADQNSFNCQRAAMSIQKNYSETTKTDSVKFWCEKGRYKK